MKKMLIALAVVSLATTAMAQDNTEVPVKKYSVATNSFWSNWFVSAGGDVMGAYSDQEYGQGLATWEPFRKLRRSFGGDISIGKWFTPGIGLRTKVAYGNLRQVNGTRYEPTFDRNPNREFGYVAEQVMLNVSNLIWGYNEKRIYNFIPYAGCAESRDFSDNAYSFVPMVGILNTFRLAKHWNFNVDIYGMIGEDNTDGIFYETSSHNKYGTARSWWKAHDRIVGASVGFTYNIGKSTWDKVPDVDALKGLYQGQIDGLNSQVNDLRGQLDGAQGKIKDLSDKLRDCENQPKAAPAAKAKMESVVTFRCDKTVIDAAQMPNVERVANFLKNHADSKVVIKGYASPEGPKDHNMKLAEQRAQSVKNCLVKKYKIDESRIEAAGNGIGDMFSEPSWNRVSICTIDD